MNNENWSHPPSDNRRAADRSVASASPSSSSHHRRVLRIGLAAGACIIATLRLGASGGPPQHYQQTNLVSDIPGLAPVTDAHLVNPWGLARSATSPWWAADNGTGLSTLYNGAGAIIPLVVTIPVPTGWTGPSAPTGIIFNANPTDFVVAPGSPARFIFATEEGTIAAWNSGTSAVIKVPPTGGSYKGLTFGQANGANYLYAANFAGGKVDVFDRDYQPVDLGQNAFKDWELPAGYAPFNVQNINGSIYVAFAKTEWGSSEEVPGPGRGYVDAFSSSGVLEKRLQWGAWLNAPWGLALAPANFGGFSNLLLVGQFGSGKIAAFDPATGKFRGLMRGAHGRPLSIDGLWALSFGNGANAGPANSLYFTAGIDDEAHGLFGSLTPIVGGKDDGDDHDED